MLLGDEEDPETDRHYTMTWGRWRSGIGKRCMRHIQMAVDRGGGQGSLSRAGVKAPEGKVKNIYISNFQF